MNYDFKAKRPTWTREHNVTNNERQKLGTK